MASTSRDKDTEIRQARRSRHDQGAFRPEVLHRALGRIALNSIIPVEVPLEWLAFARKQGS